MNGTYNFEKSLTAESKRINRLKKKHKNYKPSVEELFKF